MIFAMSAVMAWLMIETRMSGNPWLSGVIAVIFSRMVIEDFRCQTVDVRLAGMLLVVMAADVDDLPGFFIRVVSGAIFFRCLMLLLSLWATWRLESRKGYLAGLRISRLDNGSVPMGGDNHQCGYLPIFALTFIGYMAIWGNGWQVPQIFQELNAIALTISSAGEAVPEFVFFSGATLTALWLALEGYVHHREECCESVVYAFGGGDVLILALFAGFMGRIPLLWLFLASLFVQLFLYAAYQVINTKLSRGEVH